MNMHLPTPTPDCATYSPLLPLLAHGLLEATEEAEDVHAHLATCAYCRAQAAFDDELDAALRRRFLLAGDEDRLLFSTEEILQMSDRSAEGRTDTRSATNQAHNPSTCRFRMRVALVSAAAAVLLACLVGAGLFSRSGGLGGGPTTSQGGDQTLPTVGSSIDDLTQLGVRIDADLDQITADQQAAATDNSQQDQVQP